jgi:hypothetical protein
LAADFVGLEYRGSAGPDRRGFPRKNLGARSAAIVYEPSTAIITTLPWLLIPGFMVPLLFAVHIAIFARLAASASKRNEVRKARQSASEGVVNPAGGRR